MRSHTVFAMQFVHKSISIVIKEVAHMTTNLLVGTRFQEECHDVGTVR